jgi:hypothetical protein
VFDSQSAVFKINELGIVAFIFLKYPLTIITELEVSTPVGLGAVGDYLFLGAGDDLIGLVGLFQVVIDSVRDSAQQKYDEDGLQEPTLKGRARMSADNLSVNIAFSHGI